MPAYNELPRGTKCRPRRLPADMADTGIPWIGLAPKTWPLKRLRWTIESARNGVWGSEPDGESDFPCVRVADFNRIAFRVSGDIPTLRSVEPSDRRGRVLRKGDLLLEKSGGGELQPVGAVAIYDSDLPAVCSNFLARLVPAADCDSRFLSYMHAHLYSARVNVRSIKQTTGIQNLDAYSYFCEQIPVPQLDEQRTIAAFLDYETTKIDELIAKKRSLRRLLLERRTASIAHAVTKGCERTRLKPSGVEWIGEIPIHWETWRIKHVCKLETGHTPRKSDESFWIPEDCNIPWISLNDTKTLERNDFIDDTVVKISAIGMQNSSAHLIEAGAVVFNRDGARVGLAAITTRPMCVSQHLIAWVCGTRVLNKYLLNAIYAMNQEIYRITAGATIPTIGMIDIGRMTIPVPPIAEQHTIVAYLDALCSQLDALVVRVDDAIHRLQDYRSSLIAAAVTGQLDVRNNRPEASCL